MRAYLEGFLPPGESHLYCYGRKRETAFRALADDLAKQRNYYTVVRADGSFDDRLEQLLQRNIEDPGLAVVRKLANGRTRLSWQERISLSDFIALHEYRVPYMREMIEDSVKSLLEALVADINKKSVEDGEPLDKVLLQSRRDTTEVKVETIKKQLEELRATPGSHSVRAFVGHALNFSKLYRHMKWNLYEATEDLEFVTSDCPVIKIFPDSAHSKAALVREDLQLWFPVSRRRLLVMTHDLGLMKQIYNKSKSHALRKLARLPEIRLLHARNKDVLFMNEVVADHATRWVFSGHALPWLTERMQKPSSNVRAEFNLESGGYRLTTRAVYGQAPREKL